MQGENTFNLDRLFSNLPNFIIDFPSVQPTDIIDILSVTVLIYIAIRWLRETRAQTLLKGLLVCGFAYLISYNLRLHTLTFIIQRTLSLGLIAVVVIFQPEIRRALEQLGTKGFSSMAGIFNPSSSDIIDITSMNNVVSACLKMSEEKTGALIVIERNVSMDDIINSSGVTIDGKLTSQLLTNIFVDKTPLHDGAVIIRENKIAAASCVLPVTKREIGQELGTRHRAAVGASEVSDALIIVVSEETGAISIAQNGKLDKWVSESALRQELLKLIAPAQDNKINKLWKGRNKRD